MESKGSVLNFIEDVASDQKLYEQMRLFIDQRGKGWTAQKLLTKFHKLNYDDVSLKDCKKLLVNVKRIKNPSAWDWSY